MREKDNPHFKVYAIYSDDSGKTWQVSSNPASCDGDESKVVQLADGTLLMSIRNRFGTLRKFSISHDNGATWSDPLPAEDMPDPRCNGDILRYTVDGKDILLQSLPGSPNKRVDVTIYTSEDNGKTWPYKYIVTKAPSAYSAMTILPDGSIGVLTEEESHANGAYRIWYTRLPLETIMQPRDDQ